MRSRSSAKCETTIEDYAKVMKRLFFSNIKWRIENKPIIGTISLSWTYPVKKDCIAVVLFMLLLPMVFANVDNLISSFSVSTNNYKNKLFAKLPNTIRAFLPWAWSLGKLLFIPIHTLNETK